MKRVGRLYEQICSMDNLRLAASKACKGKGWQYGVRLYQQNPESNLLLLQDALISRSYKTSAYTVFTIHEPKEREIYRLPFYPDRIVHHAVMNILEPVFVSVFTADTFSCIKRRGIHAAARGVQKALRDAPGSQYCLKLDIKKFYPSIDHEVLKGLLRRKFKDLELLWLLDEIIDSAPGLPIGNYLSQYLANFYLTYFDHWIKEVLRVKYYFRYADDLVILSHSKTHLHSIFTRIREYLAVNLKLQVKSNWQVFPVKSRGIDYVGYRFFHTHIRLRKTIKQNFARMLATRPNVQSINSYLGWTGHCNGNHLTKTLLHELLFTNEHQTTGVDIHRRQDQAEQATESNHNSTSFQDRRFEIPGQRQWQKTNAASGIKWNSIRSVQRISNADADDRSSA
jgi:RNA-directed DNA polymerase